MSGVAETRQALAGVTVLDLATYLAAPLCATLLGEFGADVIKVEQPRVGDDLRRLGRAIAPSGGGSYWWFVEARNKKSITCNLRDPEGQALIRRLVATRHGPHLGVRPDRAESRASRLRTYRRRGRRPRVPGRLRGPRARIAGDADGSRLSGGRVRRRRRPRGAAPRRAHRRGPGRRSGPLRAGPPRARRRHRGVRRHGPGARADRLGDRERGAAQPLSQPRRAVDRDRLHQRPDVRALAPGDGSARPHGRSADDDDAGAARAPDARGRARRRVGRRARRGDRARRARGRGGSLRARRERARPLRGSARARAREHRLGRPAVARSDRDAGSRPAVDADAGTDRGRRPVEPGRAQRGDLRWEARAFARGARAARRARSHLTAPARSWSVATTRFERRLRSSRASWGRFRTSHSSRSCLRMSSSTSSAATAVAERGPLRKSPISPKGSPSPIRFNTRSAPSKLRRISTVPAWITYASSCASSPSLKMTSPGLNRRRSMSPSERFL